jgi:PIN domain nuclease of toxin-antitoxin system
LLDTHALFWLVSTPENLVEAALLAIGENTATGHRDPGDCFLIATARIRKIPIVTRDRLICDLAREQPDYLSVIAC